MEEGKWHETGKFVRDANDPESSPLPLPKWEKSKKPEVTSVEGRENGDRRPRVQNCGRLGRSEVDVIQSQYDTERCNTM